MSRIFESGRLLLRQTGQLRGKTFFTDHRDFGFEWGLNPSEDLFFREHLDFGTKIEKYVTESK